MALFPTYARLVLQRLLEVVQRGSEQWQEAAVAVLQIIFEVRLAGVYVSARPATL